MSILKHDDVKIGSRVKYNGTNEDFNGRVGTVITLKTKYEYRYRPIKRYLLEVDFGEHGIKTFASSQFTKECDDPSSIQSHSYMVRNGSNGNISYGKTVDAAVKDHFKAFGITSIDYLTVYGFKKLGNVTTESTYSVS